jgi:hypothetical protein
MRRDLSSLDLVRVIAHPIPKRFANRPEADLPFSNAESTISDMIRNYLTERISESLGRAACDVVVDSESESPVPALIERCLGDEPVDLVQVSSEMACHLYACQTGVNSEGLLLVALSSLRGHLSLVILKLELEGGMRTQQVSAEGKTSCDMEYIPDLSLQQRKPIFKAGLFGRTDPGGAVYGLVSDDQQRYRTNSSVARFFLSRFLGCRQSEAPEVTTQHFFNVAEKFINEDVGDPERKARYQIALLAELGSSRGTLDPGEFAMHHLEIDDREAFIRSLETASGSSARFDKDLRLIDRKIKRMRIDFESGVAVLGPADVFDKFVKTETLPDGKALVKIEDMVKSVHAKR